MKKEKKVISRLPKIIVAFTVILAMLLSYIAPMTHVFAETYGEGTRFIHMDITNTLSFTINSVTVNGNTWTGASDEFHTNDDTYHIEINVSGNQTTGDKVPRIQYGGNWNGYITPSTEHNENNYTFVLDVNNSSHQEFLALEILEQQEQPVNPNPGDQNQGEPQTGNDDHGNEPHFDGKAYVIWSCGNGTCYHRFTDIPNFNDGNSKFYSDTEVTADNKPGVIFDVNARYKGWALDEAFDRWVNAYKSKNNVSTVDWDTVDASILVGNPPDMREWEEAAQESGACNKNTMSQDEFVSCVDNYAVTVGGILPFIKLQPVGEPEENDAYVSYGDRNFKVVIHGSEYRGVSIGDTSELHYYPAQWANAYIKRDQFDLSGSTKENPTGIDTILLESIVTIKALNPNGFIIKSMEALDVPEGAVEITKQNNGDFKLVFSSNFYDNVIFKVVDNNNEEYYLLVKRTTIDGWIGFNNGRPTLIADFYFDREKLYSDFHLTAKIVYKDGTTRNVTLVATEGIDDGLGNITPGYEADEEHPMFGPAGKGLKHSTFKFTLNDGDDRKIKKIYLNAEYKGSTKTSYAGAYVGSGEGVLANLYQGEDE